MKRRPQNEWVGQEGVAGVACDRNSRAWFELVAMASQTIVSWDPLAEWLQAVDKLRRAGLGVTGAIPRILVKEDG